MNDSMFKPLTEWGRWDFLSVALPGVLAKAGAYIADVTGCRADFMGGIVHENGLWLRLEMPAGQDPLERELTARGLLAAWYGVDTSGWPVDMRFEGQGAQA